VHLASWPRHDPAARDEALEARMDLVRRVVSVGHAARQKAGIKVRTPVLGATVHLAGSDLGALGFADVVRDELNLLRDPAAGTGAVGRLGVSFNKKEAAPRLGARTAAVAAAVARLPAGDVERLVGEGKAIPLVLEGGERMEIPAEFVTVTLGTEAGADAAYERGVGVRLDTTRTPEVVRLGLVREFVHALQGLRKEKGFRVTDRVRLAWSAEGALAEAVRAHEAYVREEVLAIEVSAEPGLAGGDEVEVEGSRARVRLEVVPA
jgi:isoleucyl-tRNA synthetase